MLSASQGKYDLHKSSGSIGENIKYIYYFTYFYKFEVHPFWDKFEKEFKVEIEGNIKKKVEELKKSVKYLQEMHKTLSAIVSSYSNPNNLIVKCVETIRCDIDTIYCDLNCYVVEEFLRIKVQLDCKKLDFEKQIKCSCPKLSSEISIVKKTLKITTKITYIVKTTIETMSKINYGSIHKNQHLIKEITQKSEETVESRKIEKRLKSICDYIKKLPSTLSFSDLKDLTCDNFDKYFDKIKDIEEYIKKLDRVIEYIRNRKSRLEDIIIKNSQNITITESSGERWKNFFSTQSGGHEETTTKLEHYYEKEVTKIENLITVNRTIKQLLTEVCCDIDNLEKEITCFKQKLETVKEKLQDLQTIRGFSEELRGLYFIGQLNRITGISNNLNCDKDDKEIIEEWDKTYRRWYLEYIKLIRDNVKRFLLHSEIESAGQTSSSTETQCSSNPHLKTVKSALECVNTELDNLEKYGNNIGDLIKMARILTKLLAYLENVDSVMSTVHRELQQLGDQLDTTGQQLDIINTFRDTVEQEIITIAGYIDAIKAVKELGEACEEIPKLYKAYLEKFTAFKDKLEQLERCLDYLVDSFLRCSLCTTICNLKKLVKTTVRE